MLVWAATRDEQLAAGAQPAGVPLPAPASTSSSPPRSCSPPSRLDARLLRLFGPVVYLASLLGLLLVLVAGTTINGAHAWIRLGGGFELQPSEFMKLGLIVGMAVLFTQRARERARTTTRPADAPRDVLLALGADRGAARR